MEKNMETTLRGLLGTAIRSARLGGRGYESLIDMWGVDAASVAHDKA